MRDLVMWSLVAWSCTACLVPDAVLDAYLDQDGDGERTAVGGVGTDCDDGDAFVNTKQQEICGDAVDNDCDDVVDDVGVGASVYFGDGDADGHGAVDKEIERCVPPAGYVEVPGDCNDADKRVHPGADEICGNGVDEDCSGEADDGQGNVDWWRDVDGDGFGTSLGQHQTACAHPGEGWTQRDGDCDDERPDVHPEQVDEPYDGLNADCSDGSDFDVDGDGYLADPWLHDIDSDDYPPEGLLLDCDDSRADVNPNQTDVWYDGIDTDCAGNDDFDQDGDGVLHPSGGGDDCDDTDPDAWPGAPETWYDGIDQDCIPGNDADADGDGHDALRVRGDDCDDDDVDNWFSCATCVDADGDGGFTGCDAYTTRPLDCDDDDDTVGPGALEIYGDGIDQDCDGVDLTAIAGAGIFVSPTGIDTPTCGTLSSPCREPAHAEPLAHAAELPIFLAAGTYGPFTTRVSVWGGFDGVTWARDVEVWRSEVRGSLGSGGVERTVQVTGDRLAVGGLDISPNAVSQVAVGLDVVGDGVLLEDIEIEMVDVAQRCTGAEVKSDGARLERVEIDGCSGYISSIGLSLHESAGLETSIEVVDSRVAVIGSSVVTSLAVGLLVRARGVSVHDVDIAADGAGEIYGVDVAQPQSTLLPTAGPIRFTEVAVDTSAGSTAATSAAFWMTYDTRVELNAVRASSATTPTAHAVRLQPEIGGSARIVGCQLVAAGTSQSYGIEVLDTVGPTPVEIAMTTVLSTNGLAGKGLRLKSNDVEIVNTVLVDWGTALEASGTIDIDGFHVDGTCIMRAPGGGCVSESVFEQCLWTGCSSVGDVASGDSLLDPSLGTDPVVLSPLSPLVDAGVPPAAALTLGTDLHGQPRPAGSEWDIGAVEHQPTAPPP